MVIRGFEVGISAPDFCSHRNLFSGDAPDVLDACASPHFRQWNFQWAGFWLFLPSSVENRMTRTLV
jgi:hypothetical protein